MSDKCERMQERAAVCADRREEFANCSERRANDFRDPVCIHTDQVYDSCKERDCIKDQRVYFTCKGQEIIDHAINVKVKNAEIIWIYTNVEPVPFNRGFYSIDIKYFIKVTVEAFRGVSNPCEVEGLTTFDKKVILFGSEGNAKIFQSKFNPDEAISQMWQKNNLPKAIVEVVDPIALSARLVTKEECCCCCDCGCNHFPAIPENICECFDDELFTDDDCKQVLVTLGLFTIVKIERNVQLLIHAIDFCVPQKECPAATDRNPCELFNTIRFPMDEFFPPQKGSFEDDDDFSCGCGCNCNCGCN